MSKWDTREVHFNKLGGGGPLIREPGLSSSFMYLHGGHLVYTIASLSIVVNRATAVHSFAAGMWFLGLWAGLALYLLPSAFLALILVTYRDRIIIVNNLPLVLNGLFPWPWRSYKDAYFSKREGYAREGISLVIWCVPGIIAATRLS